MQPQSENVLGNVYDKYGTTNPIARRLMAGFLEAVVELGARSRALRILEVGCGEGKLARHLWKELAPERLVACDLSLDRLEPNLDPRIEFWSASIYELPFTARSFDLVVCCEVLEHLEDPERGLAELCRVSAGRLLLSTPREPLWRCLNVLRGKYLSDFGNTPGHVQHFSASALLQLVEPRVRVLARRQPIPWTILLGEPRPC